MTTRDQWAQWLLHRRHGDDPERLRAALESLYPMRDKVLQNARLSAGEVLLDVGAGDGLIAFGALTQVGEQGKVIFSDISQDLLDHSQSLARQMGVLERCQFVRASADDLSMFENASVDVVTTRSVLIYVAAKQQAFKEFFRVLRPKGRLSIFEPINRFGRSDFESHTYFGCDVTPIIDIVNKVRAVFSRYQSRETDPMLDFDERDLLTFAEKAGFQEIHLELQADIGPRGWWGQNWESVLRTASNPKIPTLEEAMNEALTPSEAEKFVAYLRPLIERGQTTSRFASAYLWAVRH